MAGTSKAKKRKLNNKKGFTIAEMLVAILILLMVSSIVATGIPVAREAYEKVVLTSNAEILMSTAISALRNELGTAKDIEASGTEIIYYNSARGSTSKILIEAPDIKIQRYFSDTGLSQNSDITKLLMHLEDENVNKDLSNYHVIFSGISYDKTKGVIKVTDLTVYYKTRSLLKRNVSIRVISQEKITE